MFDDEKVLTNDRSSSMSRRIRYLAIAKSQQVMYK